jgi:methyltransferase (TIGR00027 family)
LPGSIVPEHVTFAGIDFDRQVLSDVLEAAGFKKGRKTLFLWEGVTQYLTEESVKQTLKFVSDAKGAIAFTYVRQGIIDGSARPDWFNTLLAFARKVGSPFTFGLNPLELASYLADLGLTLLEDVGAVEYRKQYLVPLGRKLNVFDAERVAVAAALP